MWKCENFLSSLAPLARIFIDFSQWVVFYDHYTVVYRAMPEVIKENCIDCMYICRCILRPENICFWGARSRIIYKLQFFLSVHLGGLLPNTKKLATLYCPSLQKVITFVFVFLLLLACLSACSAGKWGPFLGEDYFFGGGGGGGAL